MPRYSAVFPRQVIFDADAEIRERRTSDDAAVGRGTAGDAGRDCAT